MLNKSIYSRHNKVYVIIVSDRLKYVEVITPYFIVSIYIFSAKTNCLTCLEVDF